MIWFSAILHSIENIFTYASSLESSLSNGVTPALLLNLTAEKSAVHENEPRLLFLGFISLIKIMC